MKKAGLTPAAVAAQLRRLNGNMAAVARHFGVARQSVWGYVQDRDELKAISAECRESMKDEAESVLFKQLKKGEAWAVCFFLKTQAKDRGYVERQEVEPVGKLRVVEELAGDDGDGEGPAAQEAT